MRHKILKILQSTPSSRPMRMTGLGGEFACVITYFPAKLSTNNALQLLSRAPSSRVDRLGREHHAPASCKDLSVDLRIGIIIM